MKRRGLVIGIFGAATSAGQLIFLPLLASLTVNQRWRTTSTWIALAAAIAVLPVALFVRNDPAALGLAPYGGDKPVPIPRPDPRVMGRAIRTPDFWLLAGTFGICGLTSNGTVGTHFICPCRRTRVHSGRGSRHPDGDGRLQLRRHYRFRLAN